MKRFLALMLLLMPLLLLLPPARAEEVRSAASPAASPSSSAPSEAAASSSPAATPVPEAAAEPEPTIYLLPEPGLPLPGEKGALTEKRPFAFGGTVVSSTPLCRVAVTVSDEKQTILLQAEASPETEEEALRFPLWDKTYPFEDQSLSGQTDFAALKPGVYTFTLTAACDPEEEVILYSAPFTVERVTALHTLLPNDLRGTYPAAEAFLGEGNLPFTYQTGTYGQIWVDYRWQSQNLVSISTPFGEDWRVNKAAEEPFRQALQYMRTTYVHVGGKWDSGIVRLSHLVRAYNGPFIGRMEENTPFLSPHVLGLAVDLNPGGPNEAVPDNWATFCKEISENLIYNGIRERNGYRYYDFTYIGTWGTAYNRVPTILQNYLLYELAFYRAGFFWGVYYDHTCDGSHFGLGEYDPSVHSDSPLALRKVFEYIEA